MGWGSGPDWDFRVDYLVGAASRVGAGRRLGWADGGVRWGGVGWGGAGRGGEGWGGAGGR